MHIIFYIIFSFSSVFAHESHYKNINKITLDASSYCLLSEGKIDAVIESDLKIYDVAAIIPIVENAGGLITTWNNKNAVKGGNILATSNKKLHYKLLNILKKLKAKE